MMLHMPLRAADVGRTNDLYNAVKHEHSELNFSLNFYHPLASKFASNFGGP